MRGRSLLLTTQLAAMTCLLLLGVGMRQLWAQVDYCYLKNLPPTHAGVFEQRFQEQAESGSSQPIWEPPPVHVIARVQNTSGLRSLSTRMRHAVPEFIVPPQPTPPPGKRGY